MVKPLIDSVLVHRLVSTQFPEWKALPVVPVYPGGWDNRTFRLGKHMLVRMPSAEEYAQKVIIEQEWLPKLSPYLPLPIPCPLGMGRPTKEYPWHWSVYRWIEGESATLAGIHNLDVFAIDLAHFLGALYCIPSTDGIVPGNHNFYRGGPLNTYDKEIRQACNLLKNKIDTCLILRRWEDALSSSWTKKPVWIQGDVSVGNLLVKDGKLCAVIDFGGMAMGDPACDLVITWTLFKGSSREIFKKHLSFDRATWRRAQGWALWKATIVAAGLAPAVNTEDRKCWEIIAEVLADI